jgi:hypothetical protein
MLFLMWLFEEPEGPSESTLGKIVKALWPHLGPTDYLLLTLLFAGVAALVSVVSKKWLEEKIEHKFKEQLEDYKLQLLKELEDYKSVLGHREQAIKIAELLALVRTSSPADLRKANQLSWELVLWLPPQLIKDLTKVLSGANHAQSDGELLIQARCAIQGKREPDILITDIPLFEIKVHKEDDNG